MLPLPALAKAAHAPPHVADGKRTADGTADGTIDGVLPHASLIDRFELGLYSGMSVPSVMVRRSIAAAAAV
jgi:hypothetical protein